MLAQKQKLIDILRSRGQSERADWVERDLPDEFETALHRGLLVLLRVEPDDLADAANGTRPDLGAQGTS